MAEPRGVLYIDKGEGMTSHDVVNRIRRLYGTKKVGHTGTLDPMATGLLTVMIGRAAKVSELLMSERKRYTATLRLGLVTDSGDITGNVLSTCDTIPTEDDVQAVLPAFRGKIKQVPPMYSALKVNGQKLVDLARKGIEVDRQAREIEIYGLTAEKITDRDYRLDVTCSKGTYIRTLCEDIGASLGCGATMASLRRTESGSATLKKACTLAELEEKTAEGRLALLLPVEELFADCPILSLPPFFEHLARNGLPIYQKKIGTAFPADTLVRMGGQKGFFALGRVGEYEEGSAVKPIKQMDVE